MFGVGFWLFVCVVWAAVAWLMGASLAVVTLPYWGTPFLLVSYLCALEGLDAFDARMRRRRERATTATQLP